MTITTTGSSPGAGEQFVMETTGALRGPPGPQGDPGIQGPPGPGSASEEKTLAELGSTYLASLHPRTTVFVTDMSGAPVYSYGANWRSYATNDVVAHDPITPASVLVSPKPFTLAPGLTQQMSAVVGPTGAPQTVTWSSSNTAVATVSANGLVTSASGATVGDTASISATTANSVSDSSVMTIVSGVVLPTSVSLSPSTFTVLPGATQQLTPTVLPSNATNKSVTYSSSNTAIATVNASGVVTAVGAGNVTITATAVAAPVSGTSAGTVAKQVKALGSFNLIGSETITAPAGRRTVFMPMKMVTASGDADGIILRYPARILRFDNTGSTEPLGNDMVVLEAALERNGTSNTTPVKVGGSRTWTIVNGTDAISDLITPQMLGFTTSIPVGTVLWSKIKFTVPEGGKVSRNQRLFYAQGNVPGLFYDPAVVTVPSVDTIGTSTNIPTNSTGIESPWGPYLLGTYVNPATKAFSFEGDSIGAGQADDNSYANTGAGYLFRALGQFTTPMAGISLCVPGSKSTSGNADPYLLELLAYGPDGLAINWGTNDGGDGSTTTPAQAISNIQAQIARYKAAPGIKAGVKAAVAKLLPRTYDPTGTPYVQDSTQQIYTNPPWGVGGFDQAFNALVTTVNFDGVLQQDVVRSTTDIYKWAGPTRLTLDGTHPNAAGYTALAAPTAVALKALWMS